MLTAQMASIAREPVVAGDGARSANARLAGIGLLVALASIIVLYGGSGAVAGTRPDTAEDVASIRAFFGQPGVGIFFAQGIISALGLAFFAIAFRRYLQGLATSALGVHVIDFGTVIVLLEIPVLVVVWGLQLALVRLSSLGDPSLVGVFLAWDWIDNGTMLWLEAVWMGGLSLGAWMTRGLPRPLAGLGLVVALLIAVLAAPALALRYPLGVSFVAYVPFMAWMLLSGLYLVRGGVRGVVEGR